MTAAQAVEPESPAEGDRFDLAIVGAGILGLATAYRLLERHPGLRLAVLDKEPEVASHQTGHNSGVIHAGLYYAPGSRKARLCREGKASLEAFAEAHGIPFERPGKLVVAVSPDELPRLEDLERRATANGVPGLRRVGPAEMRDIEPHAVGLAGLYSPTTGIVDFRRVAVALAAEVRERGGAILLGHEVTAIRDVGPERVVATATADGAMAGDVCARDVIACAGLESDRVAALTGDEGTQRIVPFRGDYWVLRPEARGLVRALIYPVPDPRFPFLGVHFTRRIDGEVWAGPNAVLAFAREGYRRADISAADLRETLGYRGFLRVAFRYWRMGAAELWRDVSRRAFAEQLRRYVPDLRDSDLLPGPSGVRAQSVRLDGSMVDDFSIGGSAHVLHVRNAPSPAATASLAIGRELADLADRRFGLA